MNAAPKPQLKWQRLGRRGRWEGEWAGRLFLLSNRLTRYAFACGEESIQKHVYARMRLAEVRMADIVFAATAIESLYLRIRRLATALAATPFFQPAGDGIFRGGPEFGQQRHKRLVAAAPDAYFDFHSMLWWGRSLLDRIEGGWGERVKGEWIDHPIGLVEFLVRGDAARMRKARDRLRRGAFAEVKDLADYSLHAFAVPRPDAMLHFEADATVTLPLPDRLGRRPKIGEEFTFNERRHVSAEAEQLWQGVQTFMSEAFVILEDAQLRREEALTGDRLELVRLLRRDFMPDRLATR